MSTKTFTLTKEDFIISLNQSKERLNNINYALSRCNTSFKHDNFYDIIIESLQNEKKKTLSDIERYKRYIEIGKIQFKSEVNGILHTWEKDNT